MCFATIATIVVSENFVWAVDAVDEGDMPRCIPEVGTVDLNLGVDPQMANNANGGQRAAFNVRYGHCTHVNYARDQNLPGCVIGNALNPVDAGARYMKDASTGVKIEYTLYASFGFFPGTGGGNLFYLPVPSIFPSIPTSYNVGYPFSLIPSGGVDNSEYNLQAYIMVDLRKEQRGFRFIPAGNYSSDVALVFYFDRDFKFGTTCQPTGRSMLLDGPTSLHISAIVTPKCTITNITPLDFGSWSNLKHGARAASTVDVGCNESQFSPLPFTLKFNDGQNAINGQRRLRSGDNYIDYNINYLRTGVRAGSTPEESFQSRGSGRVNLLGTINPKQEKIPAGKYTDVVIVTVEY